MSLAITEDHRAFADLAAAVVAARGGMAAARDMLLNPDRPDRWWAADELWKEMASAGWLGLHIDERFGGQGYGLPELTVVMEQLGRAAIGGPFLPTVAASVLMAEFGSEQQQQRWLPRLASGELIAGVSTTNTAIRSDSTITGTNIAVLGDSGSDVYLITVGEDIVLVEDGDAVCVQVGETNDMLTRPLVVLELSAAPVADVLVGAAASAVRTLRLLAAAEAVGGLAACTEMATSYAKDRRQFDRPIGSFQAIKHHCANMLVDSELAVAVTWDAARRHGPEADLAVTMAAGHVLPAYQRVALQNLQIHGGIGYTWEHDAHLFIRRATILLAFCGGREALHDKVVELQRAGVRLHHALDLPPEAQQYRLAAEEFRSELVRADVDSRPKLWARSGYLQPHWPPPFGRGADSVEQLIIDEVLGELDKPHLGLGEWVVPTLLEHGSPEQVERLIWPSLEGELRWCQLFSEPGAGSDAAAVATKAERVEGGWSVTGQKVWTSDAMNCQRGLATVRTDRSAAKHRGITAMIIDLAAPGVEIRPLKEITGATLFNEVFFTDVFVPDRDIVGEVNAGWKVAMATFGNERVSLGGGSVTLPADKLAELLEQYRSGDTGLAREVGALLVESYCLAALNLRRAARAVFDSGPTIEGNIAKLYGAEHAQRVAELALCIVTPAVLVGEQAEVAHDYLYSRCLTIAGGTSEIIRNLIAERILGLPRDPLLA